MEKCKICTYSKSFQQVFPRLCVICNTPELQTTNNMVQLTEEQIKKINSICPHDQGIFKEPWGIPVHIKEPVIYSRYISGGMRGGNCWGDKSYFYEESIPKDRMKVLDYVLAELCPNITFLQFREIEALICDNTENEYEYYGNSTDYVIEYIKLSELYNLLEKL